MTRGVPASALAIIVTVAPIAACRPGGLFFYDVERARTEQCAIRSNGEFCVEPEQFAPPVIEAWGVELRERGGLLYVDEETWVLDPVADGADPWTSTRTASRVQIVAAGESQCSTTTARALEFVADGAVLTGTFRGSTRLEGPPACGATPVGERVVEALSGAVGTP